MKKLLLALASLVWLSLWGKEPVEYVDPFIGTTNYAATNPGALRANGLMSVSPFNVLASDSNRIDKDGCWWSAPYDHRNRVFTGLSHVNLSGVGCPELGALLLTAATGPLQVDWQKYGTTYHQEEASPGYWAASLDSGDIRVEATANLRTGITRFTIPAGQQANILLNLGQGLTNETGATVKRVSPTEAEGWRLMGTFCYNPQEVFPLYFALRILPGSPPPISEGFWKLQRPMRGIEAQWTPDNGSYKLYTDYRGPLSGDDIGLWYTFPPSHDKEQVIEVALSVSATSVEKAWENMEADLAATPDFDEAHKGARQEWNSLLGRIEVEGGTEDDKTVFYTALYHSLIHPNLISDATDPEDRYTVFSLWDTYRNLHQLLTLVYPERQQAMLRSLAHITARTGWLPRWELYGRETLTMEGDPAIPVFVDSYRKGFRNFDLDTVYAAMVRSAFSPGKDNKLRPDIDRYLAEGFVPLGAYAGDLSGDNSVSHALEYYVADNALAWLARERGHTTLADTLRQRSLQWRRYYSPETGTLRPLTEEGEFLAPFDPRQGANFEPVPGFHEGSAWNYTFSVPHDIEGLTEINGGPRAFAEKLQKFFDAALPLYDPANEPDIAYPFLFTHLEGEQWRTAPIVTRLLRKHYRASPDGLPGNDDAGTLSAWAVWAMMGLYPDIPASPEYALTTPVFSKIVLHLDPAFYPRGSIVITCAKEAAGAALIGGDGKPKYRVTHDELINKQKLHFIK